MLCWSLGKAYCLKYLKVGISPPFEKVIDYKSFYLLLTMINEWQKILGGPTRSSAQNNILIDGSLNMVQSCLRTRTIFISLLLK